MFKDDIDNFFKERVVKGYDEIQKEDPSLTGKSFYVFQTGEPSFQPELMVIGFNPGGDYLGERSLTNGSQNRYITDGGWFATLRSIVPQEYLEHCVGTNKYYVNTPQDKDIKNKKLKELGTRLTRELINIIQPKHILCLHTDTFNTIKNSSVAKPYESINFKESKMGTIPVAYIPNPSPRNNHFYKGEKLSIYRESIVTFINN